ncbi:MAG: 50S ribosomal protein L35 [bacterium]
MGYKLKTKKGAAKRFKVTGKGKIKRKKAFSRHKLSSKSAQQKRNLRKSGLVSAAETKRIKILIPYL